MVFPDVVGHIVDMVAGHNVLTIFSVSTGGTVFTVFTVLTVLAVHPRLPGGTGRAVLPVAAILPVGPVLSGVAVLPGGTLLSTQFVQGNQVYPICSVIVLYVSTFAAHLWRSVLGAPCLAGP